MRRIPLSNGGSALVDDEDFDYLSRWKWHRHPQGYAARSAHGRKVLMHREIARPGAGLEVDHINRDKLDNRRVNLRCVTHAENERNKPKPTRNTSGVKGVCWDKARGKWMAKTKHLGRHINLGRYDTIEEAESAYLWFVEQVTVVPQVAEQVGRLILDSFGEAA